MLRARKSSKIRQTFRQAGLTLLFLAVGFEVVLVSPEQVNSDQLTPLDRAQLPNAEGAQHILTGVHLVEATESGKEWELWAESALGYNAEALWKLKAVKVRFFSEDGTYFIVTGDEGEILSQGKDMNIRGNVQLTSSNGYRFSTAEALYSSANRRLECPGKVDMSGPKDSEIGDLQLVGEKMDVDLKTDRILVRDKVQARRVMDDGKILNLSSREAIFSSRDYSATFGRDVVIDLEGQKISGPRADFQYDRESKKLVSLLVDGGARLSEAERWARAEQIHLHFVRQEVTLNGTPVIFDGENELHGEEIVVSKGGEEIRVQRARARIEKSSEKPAGNLK
jgi:LPS export ABC transporter protein LptC